MMLVRNLMIGIPRHPQSHGHMQFLLIIQDVELCLIYKALIKVFIAAGHSSGLLQDDRAPAATVLPLPDIKCGQTTASGTEPESLRQGPICHHLLEEALQSSQAHL